MLLLAAFAFFVWYGCYRWRRRLLGFLSLAGGVVIVLLSARAYQFINRAMGSPWPPTCMLLVLFAELVLLLVVGGVMVCVPRERPALPCRGCRYDLVGLEAENPRCPECGLEHAARRPTRVPSGHRRLRRRRELAGAGAE